MSDSEDKWAKLGWDYPIINYSMLPIWSEELAEVGKKVVQEKLSSDAGMANTVELWQRFAELSYLCGISLPGTYRDAQGQIRNNDIENLSKIMDNWLVKRESS